MDEADYPTLDPKLLEDPVFQALVAEGLAIQERFAAEPVYARTGKGYLKSLGVAEMERARDEGKDCASKPTGPEQGK